MDIKTFWQSAGFEECSTGGGCVAYFKQTGKDGAHVLVTNAEDESTLPTSLSASHDVGLYDANAQQTDYRNFDTAKAALAWIAEKCAS